MRIIVEVKLEIELLDNSKFAGNYNIPHIIKQIKVYLKNSLATTYKLCNLLDL